ncbi:MAG: exosortase/archaeosortase family protein [Armatimonadetes bacterium]|nr:exosortase/archaeosortase family protein [Armatimonadota bacterium]
MEKETRLESSNTIKSTSDWNLLTYSLIAVSCVLLLVLYVPVFRWWYQQWTVKDSYYSHGFLIPPISAFIIYLKRKELRKLEIKPSARGWLFIIPAGIIALLSLWGDARSVAGLMLPIILCGIVALLFGMEILRELLFPILFLFFMCVIPSFLIATMSFKIQILSTIGGTWLLKLFGFNAERAGVIIYLPYITVEVGAPCSGFRLLISLFAFSTLFAYIKEGPLWGKLVLILSTLPLSLVINSLRVAMIGMVGDLMGYEAMHTFHDYSGYIVLVFAFVFLSLLSRWVGCRKYSQMLYS